MADEKNVVLVVEDEPDERRFLATVLEDGGYQTMQVADGKEAIKLIGSNPPDLVTLDITMPEKSGVAVYRFVKESKRFRTLPVIIVTGITEDFRRFISTRRQVPVPPKNSIRPEEGPCAQAQAAGRPTYLSGLVPAKAQWNCGETLDRVVSGR